MNRVTAGIILREITLLLLAFAAVWLGIDYGHGGLTYLSSQPYGYYLPDCMIGYACLRPTAYALGVEKGRWGGILAYAIALPATSFLIAFSVAWGSAA